MHSLPSLPGRTIFVIASLAAASAHGFTFEVDRFLTTYDRSGNLALTDVGLSEYDDQFPVDQTWHGVSILEYSAVNFPVAEDYLFGASSLNLSGLAHTFLGPVGLETFLAALPDAAEEILEEVITVAVDFAVSFNGMPDIDSIIAPGVFVDMTTAVAAFTDAFDEDDLPPSLLAVAALVPADTIYFLREGDLESGRIICTLNDESVVAWMGSLGFTSEQIGLFSLVDGFDVAIDGTSQFTAIPEPGALPLALSGFALLLLVVRRRR